MRRIIFVNRFFAPDHSATSQILSDLAFHLASRDFETHVVCGDTLYADKGKRLRAEEQISGVHVHRVSGGRFGRSGLAGRAFDYVGLYASLRQRLSALLQSGDILVVKTDPPLLSVPLAGLARSRKAVFVPWLQDLYPEVAAELGVPLVSGIGGRALSSIRDRSLRHASAIVTIGARMQDRLTARGVSSKVIHVVPNWSDDMEIYPAPHEANPVREAWGLRDKFIVGYSGNLGRAHEFQTVLSAAELLRDDKDLAFLFVGGGHHIDQLKAEARARNLEHLFHFQPYQDRAQLSQSLSAPDVHWLSLRPELEGLIVPSKFYGIAAAGRPVINIGSPDGEIAQLVSQFACGVTVAPGESAELAKLLASRLGSSETLAAMGRNGRNMLTQHFSKARAMQRWEDLLRSL